MTQEAGVDTGKEVVVEQAGMVHPLEAQMDTQKVVAKLGAIADAIAAYAKRSIQNTNVQDWVKMGDGYYLQASGAQKIRPIWGIYYRDRQVTKEIYPDGSYAYLVTGKVGSQILDKLYFGEILIEIEGGRSSRDSFFAKPGREVDPLDIRKAALANWESRAITALLGLKNMTAEDLQRNGLKVEEIQKVDYEKGAEGGGDPSLRTDAQLGLIMTRARNKGISEQRLDAYLKATFGVDTKDKIKKADVNTVLAWLDKGGPANGNGGAR